MPLRLALTGQAHGPDMAAMAPLIGREAIVQVGARKRVPAVMQRRIKPGRAFDDDAFDPPQRVQQPTHRQKPAQGRLEHRIEVTWPPTDMPWNVREMHIRHPDGHVFRISCGVERAGG